MPSATKSLRNVLPQKQASALFQFNLTISRWALAPVDLESPIFHWNKALGGGMHVHVVRQDSQLQSTKV